MKKTINAKIVADSVSPQGDRITTYLLTYPRFIHAELMTHRVFSRNSASSRAIPFNKMLKMIEGDPFIPIAWQKDHPGMQGVEYLNDNLSIQFATSNWLSAKNDAIKWAESLNSHINGYESITKQLCNRLLEPFMWHTTLVTSTEFENFFELRCPKYKFGNKTYQSRRDWYNDPILTTDDGFHRNAFPHEDDMWWYSINESGAEIHIQALAEAMWDAMNESTPNILKAWEWHIPFGDKIDLLGLATCSRDIPTDYYDTECEYDKDPDSFYQTYLVPNMLKIATARCARLSYMTFDNEIDYEKDIQLHDKLLLDKHMSPFEHCAKAMNEEEYFGFYKGYCDENLTAEEDAKNTGWCNNFKGFIPYRYLIENGLSI